MLTNRQTMAEKIAFLSIFLILSAVFTVTRADYCSKSPFNTYVYCDYKQSIPVRVKDLVGRLTVDEKITQLVTAAGAIERLDIPAYQWWSECLHGLAGSPGVHFGGSLPSATSFPQAIGMSATFNMSRVHQMGQITSTEARAFANSDQAGLTYFAPNINIVRDPRWGRGQETPGEDPYLSSQYVINFVKGIQEGEDPRYLKAVATCKHYAAYDLENYGDIKRHNFNAVVPDQDLEETYFPAFKACVSDAQVGSIMCSYNAVNGVPSCANDFINNKVAREEWGFQGYVVSDCGAINDIISNHKYTSTPSETCQAGLRGGCDLNCGSYYSRNVKAAYTDGSVTDDDLNLAMTRLFTYRMRLGMFDPPEIQPYRSYTPDMVNTKEHQDAALDAARESIVLLQNNNDILPLDKTQHDSIAVIGPNANAQGTMQGNYHGTAPYLISPVQGFQNLSLTVATSQGCDVACSKTDGFTDAVNTVKGAKAVVMIIGLDEGQESEGHDRVSLALPGHQTDLLSTVKKSTSSGVPFIVVVMSGSSVDLTDVKSMADAVLWVGYPGQSGGQAIAEVIYGLVNPSGRLPITFYPASYISIPYTNMSMRVPPGRSYKFYTGTPVFPFGCGLSYTTFSMNWSNIDQLQDVFNEGQSINYEVTVTNTGKIAGGVSVLAFISSDVPGAPMKELFGFKKVFLESGQNMNLTFVGDGKTFSTVDILGKRAVRSGRYTVVIGDTLTHTVTVL